MPRFNGIKKHKVDKKNKGTYKYDACTQSDLRVNLVRILFDIFPNRINLLSNVDQVHEGCDHHERVKNKQIFAEKQYEQSRQKNDGANFVKHDLAFCPNFGSENPLKILFIYTKMYIKVNRFFWKNKIKKLQLDKPVGAVNRRCFFTIEGQTTV